MTPEKSNHSERGNAHTQAIFNLIIEINNHLNTSTFIEPIIDNTHIIKRNKRSIILRKDHLQFVLERIEDIENNQRSAIFYRLENLSERKITLREDDITTVLKTEFQLPVDPNEIEDGSEDYLLRFSASSIQKLSDLIKNADVISS